jgi:hypothetical protein
MFDAKATLILNLIRSGVPTPEERLEKMFEFYFKDALEAVKLSLGASGAIFASLFFAYYKGELNTDWYVLVPAIVLGFVPGIYGLVTYYELQEIQNEYGLILRLLSRVSSLSDAITRRP